MLKELVLFVPGLSSTAPAKYDSRFRKNLEHVAGGRGGIFEKADDALTRGIPGGATAFEYDPRTSGAERSLIVFREVVWGDLPRRLSDLSSFEKFKHGFGLLFWATASLLSKLRVFRANKYQWFCMLGSLLTLVLWYLGVLMAVPTALDYALLPEPFRDAARSSLGSVADAISGVSAGGVNLWILTSVLLGIFPVTALVDSAFAMKQYFRDSPTNDDSGFVGEEARARIANALKAVRTEQCAPDGPAYSRITVLTHSFGAAPALEALAEFGVDLKAPVQVITLGAPLSLITAMRPRFEQVVREFCAAGRSSRGTTLAAWRCVWSPHDYVASDPDTVLPAGPSLGRSLHNEPIQGSPGYWLFNDHGAYFDDDHVAAIILDRSVVPPAPAAFPAAPPSVALASPVPIDVPAGQGNAAGALLAGRR